MVICVEFAREWLLCVAIGTQGDVVAGGVSVKWGGLGSGRWEGGARGGGRFERE